EKPTISLAKKEFSRQQKPSKRLLPNAHYPDHAVETTPCKLLGLLDEINFTKYLILADAGNECKK
ncbi:Hypothetical predicted protein, partial [Paramuricea clavata]